MSNTVNFDFEKAALVLRKGARAYLGLNVVAFEAAKERIVEARKNSDVMFERLVAKGEKMEAEAGETLQDVRARIQDRVQGFSPKDRTVEIKVKTKATKPAVKATVKTTTVKKTAAKKPVAKKPVAKKTTAKKTTKRTVKKAA